MPKTKEHKETVTYPPSKRKPPPFKPQRPSKLPRTATTDSERSEATRQASESVESTQPRTNNAKASIQRSVVPGQKSLHKAVPRTTRLVSDTEDDINADSDSLPDDPLAAKASRPVPKSHRHIDDALLNVLTDDEVEDISKEALPPDIDEKATIPQPLLLRLMHERFESKDTKIDKHAVIVLQKYIDVFVRETIARAALSKKDDVENGRASQADIDWLDRQDLEKVAGSMLMDF
ncbi:hypothetical protein AMS68_001790 [Peltaster fructicola]|uniref:Uncharacterized protein n=1 Tax=Peltaster fructicola TaxID=286661 RepID=A0A6H0XNI0_9PEZI|nr:hypothetical protein AMS68_001790 [Peltaster fructicola]